ncbi:hypothetical protein GURASL_13750 [Geotalea uraniireducens]|uniref:DUF4376 domain-containing protein n=1 Tax=Geotalea uraniireducens TaxID=351604 RepID=A0ABN6VSQ8_9BACT|nr:DUF4376 domain-containing protein [Geotalea uraniireducens]BDV42452.1 hypothetical protein GURASL_13750 [Geotalea uraniireducens]
MYAQFNLKGLPVAFYSEDIHGSLTLLVVVNGAEIDAYDVPSEIEKEVVNDDGSISIQKVPNPDYAPPVPQCESVANPDCKIPADAIEISQEDYMAYVNEPGMWCRSADGQRVAVVPEITPAEARAAKLADLAAYRFTIETAGIAVNGVTVSTDRESQAMLTGAWVRAQQAPEGLIDWKGITGWVQIDKATVEALAAAVGAHVQGCFSAERRHAEAIAALPDDLQMIEAYDYSSGWPIS